VGRETQFEDLNRQLDIVKIGARLDKGAAILLRGRRRVGKSALVTEFIRRSGLPSFYFQAARRRPPVEELAEFAHAIATSDLPNAALAAGVEPKSLTAALRLLAQALPDQTPAIAVIDELPWLLESFAGGAGELQRVWDRELAAKPVLLLLVGSDLGLMEAINRPDQPFYARATEMLLQELTPRDLSRQLGVAAMTAFDAYLVTGGQPLLAAEWQPGMSPIEFVQKAFASPVSALVGSGARVLDDEFPEVALARPVLRAIGGRGERAFSKIQQTAGVSQAALERALTVLNDKRIIAADEPLSTRRAAKDRRWRIADPALRFWLSFVEPSLPDIDRRRPDVALANFEDRYRAWRGRTIEPVVREALLRLNLSADFPDLRTVGGWWPRSNKPEIDLVAGDGQPANRVNFVGSIKWRDCQSVTRQEVTALAEMAMSVPGVTAATPLIAVCPAGAEPDSRLARVWAADDLLAAWP